MIHNNRNRLPDILYMCELYLLFFDFIILNQSNIAFGGKFIQEINPVVLFVIVNGITAVYYCPLIDRSQGNIIVPVVQISVLI